MGRKHKRNFNTDHHVLCKSREREWYIVHETGNVKRLNDKTHQKLHDLFSNKLPHEQIRMMYWINKGVLRKYTREIIEVLIEMERDEFYKHKFLK